MFSMVLLSFAEFRNARERRAGFCFLSATVSSQVTHMKRRLTGGFTTLKGLSARFGLDAWIVAECLRIPFTWWSLMIIVPVVPQGGGGSFKSRKPIGKVGCCESGMAERRHWWIERWLMSPLSLSFSDYLPTYLSIFYVSIYLSIYLSLSLSFI